MAFFLWLIVDGKTGYENPGRRRGVPGIPTELVASLNLEVELVGSAVLHLGGQRAVHVVLGGDSFLELDHARVTRHLVRLDLGALAVVRKDRDLISPGDQAVIARDGVLAVFDR